MVPKFPEFAQLSFDHKEHLEKHLLSFPPYSDFNFTSLWSWSYDQDTYISDLNGNLVIKFKDYITNEPFYTFIGVSKVISTIKTLISESSKNNITPHLKLIPEFTLKTAPKLLKHFEVEEDRDNFDYIYLIQEAIEFRGNKFGAKRNFVNRFKKLYLSKSKPVDISDEDIQKQFLSLFNTWQKLQGKDPTEIKNELQAIKRLFEHSKQLNLLSIGIYIKRKLVGFSINEILLNGYAINLFEKADTQYAGIFSYLRQTTAQYLSKYGCNFLNHEQDLGIQGLRTSKMSYNPQFFLKKYVIRPKKEFTALTTNP